MLPGDSNRAESKDDVVSELRFSVLRNDKRPGDKGAAVQRGGIKLVSDTIDLDGLVRAISGGNVKIARDTERIRALYEPDKTSGGADYKAQKERAISIIPASNAPAGTRVKGLSGKWHNGVYGFDIDEGELDVREARLALADWPHTLLCSVSMSGAGLALLVRGPNASSSKEYSAHWRAIEALLPDGLRANSGAASKNINRERYLAADPDFCCNPDAAALVLPEEAESEPSQRRQAEVPEDGGLSDLPGALDALAKAGLATDHHVMIAVGMCLKAMGHEFGEYDSWCDAAGCTCSDRRQQWDAFDKSDADYSAIIGMAVKRTSWRPKSRRGGRRAGAGRKEGVQGRAAANEELAQRRWMMGSGEYARPVGGAPLNSVKALEEMKLDGFFRRNEWYGVIEVLPGGLLAEGPFDDKRQIPEIRLAIEEQYVTAGFSPTPGGLYDAISVLAGRRAYNPVVDAVRAVAWDGRDWLTAFTTQCMGMDPDDRLGIEQCKLLPRGAVVRALSPGADWPYLPVMRSDRQGVGKRMALRLLAPGDYREDVDLSGFDWQKKLQERGRGASILELGEIEALGGKGMSQAKNLATLTSLSNRLAYARECSTEQVTFIVVATTNARHVLGDREHRRNPVIDITRMIDLDWLRRNRQQVWAQVCAEFDRGDFWDAEREEQVVALPGDLWVEANERSEQYEYESPISVALERILSGRTEILSADLHSALRHAIGPRWSDKEFSKSMESLGWRLSRPRIEGRQLRVWRYTGDTGWVPGNNNGPSPSHDETVTASQGGFGADEGGETPAPGEESVGGIKGNQAKDGHWGPTSVTASAEAVTDSATEMVDVTTVTASLQGSPKTNNQHTRAQTQV